MKILCLEILSQVQDSNAFIACITCYVGNSLSSVTVFHDYDMISHYKPSFFILWGCVSLSHSLILESLRVDTLCDSRGSLQWCKNVIQSSIISKTRMKYSSLILDILTHVRESLLFISLILSLETLRFEHHDLSVRL